MCGSPNSLTAARMAYITTQTEAAKSYTDSEIAFSSAVKAVGALRAALETFATRPLRAFANTFAHVRKTRGFTIVAIRTLADDNALVASWLTETRTVWRRSPSVGGVFVSTWPQLGIATWLHSREHGAACHQTPELVGGQVLGFTIIDHASEAEHDNTIGESPDGGKVVGHKDDAGAAGGDRAN